MGRRNPSAASDPSGHAGLALLNPAELNPADAGAGDTVTALDEHDYLRLAELLAVRYRLTMIDPAPAGLNRVLPVADQLVLVAPANPEAASALANTQQWLEAHGYGDLAARAVTVANGVSKQTMDDVLRAESVARGRCRAIVRVPWDDLLAAQPGMRLGTRRGAPPGVHSSLRTQTRPRTRLWQACSSPASPRLPSAEGVLVATRTKGRTRLGVRYFDDRILLTDSHAWAYYPDPLGVLRVHHGGGTGSARDQHHRGARRDQDGRRRGTPADHAPLLSGARLGHRAGRDLGSGPGWREYLEQSYQHVWAKDFWAKEIYIGVRLGQRGMRAQLTGGGISQFFGLSQFMGLYQSSEKKLGIDDEAIGPPEVAKWTESAERLGRALNASALAARHATSEEIAWLFKHTLMGATGESARSATKRRKWGAGEIETLFEGQVHNGRTVLGLEHMSGETFAAFVSFARFPDIMSFPDGEPWMHYADSLPFPVELSSRMKLIPPAKASKDVSRRLAHARDMDAHIREAGAEAPIALAEQIAAARMLQHGITKERLPFVYGWHRLIVTAPTRELCVRRVEAIVEHYRDIGINVVGPTGDQFSLLCESLPGDRIRLTSYVQRQPLDTIAGGNADGHRGARRPHRQRIGLDRPLYRGNARPCPVNRPFRSAACRRAQPAHRCRHHRRAGRREDHARHAAHLPARPARGDGRGDRPEGRRRVARRVPDPARQEGAGPALGAAAPGLLDPFSFGDDLAEKRTMATETLRLLLPRMSEERESAMIQAVGAVAGTDRPSLGKVVRYLEEAEDPAWKNTGAVIELHFRDEASPAVLRAVGRAADRRGGLDHCLHPGRSHLA